MQGQKLLPKSKVLKEEFFKGAKDGDDPAMQMSKARKHQGIIAENAPGRCASKSLIARTRRVLPRHSECVPGTVIFGGFPIQAISSR